MSDLSNQNQDEKRNALKEAKVLVKKDEYLGIPAKVFYNVVAICVIFIIAFKNILGLILAIAMFFSIIIPMYHIHKNDPFALKVWKRCLFRRHQKWCAGRAGRRKILIIRKEQKFHGKKII